MCQQQRGAGSEHGQQHRQPETEGQGVQHEPGADRQLTEETSSKAGDEWHRAAMIPDKDLSHKHFCLCGLEGSQEKHV